MVVVVVDFEVEALRRYYNLNWWWGSGRRRREREIHEGCVNGNGRLGLHSRTRRHVFAGGAYDGCIISLMCVGPTRSALLPIDQLFPIDSI